MFGCGEAPVLAEELGGIDIEGKYPVCTLSESSVCRPYKNCRALIARDARQKAYERSRIVLRQAAHERIGEVDDRRDGAASKGEGRDQARAPRRIKGADRTADVAGELKATKVVDDALTALLSGDRGPSPIGELAHEGILNGLCRHGIADAADDADTHRAAGQTGAQVKRPSRGACRELGVCDRKRALGAHGGHLGRRQRDDLARVRRKRRELTGAHASTDDAEISRLDNGIS